MPTARILLLCLLLSSSCCRYKDKDFDFTPLHNKLLQVYTPGDTLFFSSQTGDFDTITVVRMDTLQTCGCLMQVNKRDISVHINYLPKNRWNNTKTDDGLLTIEKMVGSKGEEYFIGIEYQDSLGELTTLTETNSDSLFAEYGIASYWKIANLAAQEPIQPTTIRTLFWTQKYGLTGYELGDGQFYKIKKNRLQDE